MEELQCNVVVMKRSQPKVLRLNLAGTPTKEPHVASPTHFDLEVPPKYLKSKHGEAYMIRGPFVTPTSSPEQESPSTATDIGTSSISSSELGTSPFFVSGIYGNLKKECLFINEEKRNHFGPESDTDSEILDPPSTSPRFEPWMTGTLSSSDDFLKQLEESLQRTNDPSLTSTYELLLEKLSILNREPDIGALNYKLDLKISKSVREAISLSRHKPPGPPPLCSVCQHKAPVFGNPPRWFTYAELELATDRFSEANFLAEGGFGSVHRGVLPDGQVVAVKQHKLASSQGDQEFCSEVEVLSCAQHRNVVMLIGHCVEGGRRLLVYEFICNGSLDSHLYGKLFSLILNSVIFLTLFGRREGKGEKMKVEGKGRRSKGS